MLALVPLLKGGTPKALVIDVSRRSELFEDARFPFPTLEGNTGANSALASRADGRRRAVIGSQPWPKNVGNADDDPCLLQPLQR